MASPVTALGIHLMKIVFSTFILCYFYEILDAAEPALDDALLCRACGHEVAFSKHLIIVPSSESTGRRNATILGAKDILIQNFVNPYGKGFEVITSRKADVYKSDASVSSSTFFPGFAWRIVTCPRCGFHLGWFFQPFGLNQDKKDTLDTFFGLVWGNLLHKEYADNLLITPKFRNR